MVLAVAALTDRLSASSLEVDRGRIEEDQLKLCEEITPTGEECLLNEVFVAPESKRRFVGLLLTWQLVTEPAHRPVEVMNLKILASHDLVVRFPRVRSAIAAGVKEPMQDSEKDGALDGELEAATMKQMLDHLLAAGLLPKSLEDQGRSDVSDRDGWESALSMLGEQENRAS
jgi:hypothetical protein